MQLKTVRRVLSNNILPMAGPLPVRVRKPTERAQNNGDPLAAKKRARPQSTTTPDNMSDAELCPPPQKKAKQKAVINPVKSDEHPSSDEEILLTIPRGQSRHATTIESDNEDEDEIEIIEAPEESAEAQLGRLIPVLSCENVSLTS